MSLDIEANATLLSQVVSYLGTRQPPEVFAAGLAGSADAETVSLLLNLCGGAAILCQNVPIDWRSGLDGAVLVRNGGAWRAVCRSGGEVIGFPDHENTRLPAHGEMIHLRLEEERDSAEALYHNFSDRARNLAWRVGWQSLAISLCALTVPFFTMAVYSRVIGAGAESSLEALLSGGIIVLVTMLFLRGARARVISAATASLGTAISVLVASRYLRVPGRKPTLEGIRAQVRIGQRASEVFSSQNLTALFDAPFIVLTLIAMAFVGGWMVLIPLAYLVLFFGIGLYASNVRKGMLPAATRASTERSIRLDELTYETEVIRGSGDAAGWLARFEQDSREAAMNTFESQKRSVMLQSMGTVLGNGTALVTLIVGLDLVLKGILPAGTLIGTMLLTWRVTGPAQALFLGISRINGLRNAWTQLAAALRVPTMSARAHLQQSLPADASMNVTATGLYMRFPGAVRASVTGATFDIPAGSSVVVLGPNGSGKSLLLRMMTGRLEAQSGSLQIAGAPIEQFNPESVTLRVKMATEVDAASVLSAEALARHDLIALDTPYGPGDEVARSTVLAAIASPERVATLVVATHDTTLAEVADMAIVLDKGAVAYSGPIKKPEDTGASKATSSDGKEISA